MKRNQLLIVVSVLALVLIAIFFFMKKNQPKSDTTSSTSIDSVSKSSSIDSVSKSSTVSRTATVTTLAIAYRFKVVDHTNLKNWHLFVSLNGATPTEITVAGVGCSNADGTNFIPISIDCPVAPSTTPVTIDVILKKGTTQIKHELKTDEVPSCGNPDILVMPICGFKLRQFPTTPVTNTIIITVNEPTTDNYDDVVSWPPTIH
ncbi:MAG: hypothetical protein JWN78_2734 [Bacteroidota bacterium]|nr:hypothetical protein [Bacteroidota bacterium]